MTDLSEAFCYWPNGTIAQNKTTGEYALPCDTSAGVSSCCLPGQTCNTQFRCLDIYNNFTEASCTQKDFNHYNCPCPHQVVGRDATTGCQDGTVCCGVRNSSCCAKGQGRLSILFDYYDAIPTATSDIASYISGYTPSATATTSLSGTTAQASTTGNAVPITQTASSPASTSPADSSGHLSVGARIGLGVGIALVVVAMVLLVGWLIIQKRNKKRKSNVDGLDSRAQRLEGNDYEGDTWFRNEVEGDTHHPSQKAIEMNHQSGKLRVVVPPSAADASGVSPSKSELEGHYSPYRHSPGGYELEQPERRVNELEQPPTRRSELEQPPWPVSKRTTIRHELE